MKRRDWAVAIALALCAAILAACGSSAGDGGDDRAEREEARLEFAQCMREHGIDVPDPKPGQGGIVMKASKAPGGKTSGANPDDPKTKAALAACEDIVEDLGEEMSPQREEKFKEEALAFAQCMREHGVEMPDPEFEAGGKVKMRVGGRGGRGGGPAPESPAFQKAQEACGSNGPGGEGFMFGAPPQ